MDQVKRLYRKINIFFLSYVQYDYKPYYFILQASQYEENLTICNKVLLSLQVLIFSCMLLIKKRLILNPFRIKCSEVLQLVIYTPLEIDMNMTRVQAYKRRLLFSITSGLHSFQVLFFIFVCKFCRFRLTSFKHQMGFNSRI